MGQTVNDALKKLIAVHMNCFSRVTIALTIVAAIGLYAGCSSKSPSQTDAKSAIEAKIRAESRGNIRLLEFTKTDGQERVESGVRLYRMEYELTIAFIRDCRWLHHDLLGLSFRASTTEIPQGIRGIAWIAQPENQGENVRNGDRRKLSGFLEFERTENGWRLTENGTPSPKTIERLESAPPAETTGSTAARSEAPRSPNPIVGIWEVDEGKPSVFRWSNRHDTLTNPTLMKLGGDGSISYGLTRDLSTQSEPRRWELVGGGLLALSTTDGDINLVRVTIADDLMTWTMADRAAFAEVKNVEIAARLRESDETKRILANLNAILGAAHEQALLSPNAPRTFAEFVKVKPALAKLEPVAGEDYHSVQIDLRGAAKVQTGSGRVVELRGYGIFQPRYDVQMRRIDRAELTPKFEAMVRKAEDERKIVANLTLISTSADIFYLSQGVTKTSFARLLENPDWEGGETSYFSLLKGITPVAGENYATMDLEMGKPLQVTTSEGTVCRYGD
jgi:hypothetical protein